MNINELKAEIARNGLTVPRLASMMGVSKNRLYSRINQEKSFTQSEISSIAKILKLNDSQIIKIFFDKKVS